MTEIGEAIAIALFDFFDAEYLYAAIDEVTFESGIDIFDVQAGGTEVAMPPAGTPHWTSTATYPAVYVRQGGTGETKTLKVKVEWSQNKRDGAAKLKGTSVDGTTVIEGDFTISGPRGSAVVNCTFTSKPATVANYGKGLAFLWQVTAAGSTADASGAGVLPLFFVDAKPKPIGWSYAKHYLKVIDWATAWAAGKAGTPAVLSALWDKFSDGAGARVPHATGFSYWLTGNPVQDLKTLLSPDGGVGKRGWSCKAIAHLFMECLAVHGIQCVEIIIEATAPADMFLVHNWDVKPTTVPNWEASADLYYAESWIASDYPPLATSEPTSLTKVKLAGPTTDPLTADMHKMSGVPAQGQRDAPLGFGNHWIVLVSGKLYDTSYGVIHANSVVVYAGASIAGWRVGTLADTYAGGFLWLFTKSSTAWLTHEVSKHVLTRHDMAKN